MKSFIATSALVILSACVTPYSEPDASGLTPIRAYPTVDDVCQEIKTTEALRALTDNNTMLIACPKHENGALRDRMNEGARVVGIQGDWTLLLVPAT